MLEPLPARAAVPPSPPPWAASAQGKPMRWRPNPGASRAKQAPLPPSCQCRHHRRCPRMHPRAPLTFPHLCLGLQACNASHCISGPTPTQAKQSKGCCPPLPPWAASAQRKLTRQQPDPNRSQAKQAPLPPPAAAAAATATATAAATADVHGCAAANALTSPSTPPCHRLPNNSAAWRCHFCVWEWGRGGKLFGKARGVFFLKWN